jgi:hypothetical protein
MIPQCALLVCVAFALVTLNNTRLPPTNTPPVRSTKEGKGGAREGASTHRPLCDGRITFMRF